MTCRGLALAAACCAATAAAAPAVAADQAPRSLRIGESSFWDGTFVGSASVSDPSLCDVQGPCFSYPIEVPETGAKDLRVAIDETDESNGWELRLIDPSENVAASDTTYQLGGLGERLDAEVFAFKPAAGRWIAQVIPQDVVNGTFRARAKLEGDAVAPPPMHARKKKKKKHHRHHPAKRHHHTRASARAGAVDLPPDIAPDPPWHLTFAQPLPQVATEAGNLTALAGIHNPTATVAGQPVYACLPEETAEQQGSRCLRFSSGVASVGTGQFEVYGAAPVPVAVDGGPLFQVIHRSDATTVSRPAGEFTFHRVHAHYHVLDLAEFPLYRVVSDGVLTPAGKGLKEGFCLGNLKLYDWHSFDAAPIDPNSVDNCEPSPDPSGVAQVAPDAWRFYEGVASGWEDVYTWATSGQFVSFGSNPDGRYVLRMIINPQRKFLETDYANNVAYTYFEVSGDAVRVIERGRGSDPWDPHKVVLDPEITQ
jgi:hypothetical protein